MTLPLSIAEKLQLLANGEQLPASSMKHAIVSELKAEGIITVVITGRTRQTLCLASSDALGNYLHNKYGIGNLDIYIATLKQENVSRAEQVLAGSNSKLVATRVFKGFLVNSYMPVSCMLNGTPLTIQPPQGTFQFVYDYAHFIPAADVVIVGVENAECFRWVEKLQYLFTGLTVLFISRYPQEQGKDLMRWLQAIPNQYVHLGDYDFAGINIYQQEYKQHLGNRATFFVPHNIAQLLQQHGNASLYDKQQLNATNVIEEPNLQQLVNMLHRYKKGLEQEVLLMPNAE